MKLIISSDGMYNENALTYWIMRGEASQIQIVPQNDQVTVLHSEALDVYSDTVL